MQEIYKMEWRVCAGFPDYEISECGDVRRITPPKGRKIGARLKGCIDGDGYLRYALLDPNGKKHGVIAHRLVAKTFIGPPPSDRHEVAHNNGSRVSCFFRDLRWATRKENDKDTEVHGTARAGTNNGNARLDEQDVREIRLIYWAIKNREAKLRVSDLAAAYGIHHASLIRIARGKAWACVA